MLKNVDVSVQLSVLSTGATVSMTFVTQTWTGYEVVIHVGVEVVMTVEEMYDDVFVKTWFTVVVELMYLVWYSTCGIVAETVYVLVE